MMKSKIKKKPPQQDSNFGGNLSAADANGQGSYDLTDLKNKQQQKDPKQGLMVRLAMGQKTTVSPITPYNLLCLG
jgi:hypothetical protein